MTGPRVSVAAVREAVRKRVDETSLRAVADEIGMSFSGLRSFLDGGKPQQRTLGRLYRWYYARGKSGSVPREDIEAAIAVLRSYLDDASKPRAVRERRLREVVDQLENDADRQS